MISIAAVEELTYRQLQACRCKVNLSFNQA
jgi:hypothetical protein